MLLLGCGQQQRLNTLKAQPSIEQVVSIPEGYEISFNNPIGLPIVVWTNRDNPREQYTVPPPTPLRINTSSNRMLLRFAYAHDGRLGVISPWIELTRINPPAYPSVVCEPTSTGRTVSWQATNGTKLYSAWLIRHGERQLGPFSTEQRTVSLQIQAHTIWLQWISDEVRGAFKEVSCRVDADGPPRL
jgi:hypothetical protein